MRTLEQDQRTVWQMWATATAIASLPQWWSWQRAWVGAFACYGLMSAAAWFSSRMMRDNIALYRYRSRALQRLRRSQMHATALEAWAAAAATLAAAHAGSAWLSPRAVAACMALVLAASAAYLLASLAGEADGQESWPSLLWQGMAVGGWAVLGYSATLRFPGTSSLLSACVLGTTVIYIRTQRGERWLHAPRPSQSPPSPRPRSADVPWVKTPALRERWQLEPAVEDNTRLNHELGDLLQKSRHSVPAYESVPAPSRRTAREA